MVDEVYEATKAFPKEELFELTGQIRRAAISVPSNLAEGCGSNTDKDSLQYFFIARGSLYELETQLYLALDQNYLTNEKFNELNLLVESCKKLLNGFLRYYRQKASSKNTAADH